MKSSGMARKATLQASQSYSNFFGFLLHSSPDMLKNIHIWRLCWPSLKDLDLLPPEKLHSGIWGMARSSILLKNLTPLVVGNVLGGKNLLIFGTINVTIHLTGLPGTSILHETIIFPPPLLGEPWVQTGPWGSSTILAELTWRLIWKIKFPSGCGPWRMQRGFLAVSCSNTTVETIVSKNQTYSSWWNRQCWHPLLLELWGRPASCHLEQYSCAVCPTWVCLGHCQSLGSTW